MLTLKQLRDDKEAAVRRLAKKGVDARPVIDRIEQLDDRRKAIQQELDNCLSQQNQAAKMIGALMGQGKRDEAEAKKAEVAALKEKSVKLSAEMKQTADALQAEIVLLPNFPAEIVPEGTSAEDNLVVKLVENYTPLPAEALPHWELAKKYNIIDFDLGVKLTGAGFPVYKGKGARLQRALINYFLDYNTRAGYQEVEPPVMVNEASGFGTGQLPDKEGQMYHATVDNFYLVPTAEVPVTNIFRDVILDEKDFPVKMTAYTPCFRREAGSYGKDVRGLNRLRFLRSARRHGGPRRGVGQVARPALPHPASVRRRHVVHFGADLRLRGLLRSAEALAGSIVRLELRVVPGQPAETTLPRREQENPFGPYAQRLVARTSAHRRGVVGEQPDARRHPDSRGADSLHGV